MTQREGFDPNRDIPVRRGRRDPEMAMAMGLEPQNGNYEQPAEPEPEFEMVSTDDVLFAKSSICLPVAGHESWSTYGAYIKVRPGETEEDANNRLVVDVNVRLLEAHEDLEARVLEMEEARRNAPIVPRGAR